MQIEELRGLPGDPPYPIQIALPGVGTFREGYVLKIQAEGDEPWVSNFQKGGSNHCSFQNLADGLVAVVAGGQGYVLDARARNYRYSFGGDVMRLFRIQGTADFLAVGSTDVARHSGNGTMWRSRRISWDGFRALQVEGTQLVGDSRRFDDTWDAFKVNLESGAHTGGSCGEA